MRLAKTLILGLGLLLASCSGSNDGVTQTILFVDTDFDFPGEVAVIDAVIQSPNPKRKRT